MGIFTPGGEARGGDDAWGGVTLGAGTTLGAGATLRQWRSQGATGATTPH